MNRIVKRISKLMAIAACAALFVAAPALAQKQPKAAKTPATTGIITGSISGEHGMPLSGAKITLLALDTKSTSTATTDANGVYTFDNLQPGDYEVTFDSKGYVEKTERTRVKAGKKVNMGERMKVPYVAPAPDAKQ
jgi:5-hydroxyisourate hydrolase-like protein (transthyretin family)